MHQYYSCLWVIPAYQLRTSCYKSSQHLWLKLTATVNWITLLIGVGAQMTASCNQGQGRPGWLCSRNNVFPVLFPQKTTLGAIFLCVLVPKILFDSVQVSLNELYWCGSCRAKRGILKIIFWITCPLSGLSVSTISLWNFRLLLRGAIPSAWGTLPMEGQTGCGLPSRCSAATRKRLMLQSHKEDMIIFYVWYEDDICI